MVKGYISRLRSNYLVLNNLRNKFDPILEKVGVGFANLGFGPNFWTWLGLILSIISAIMFSLHSPSVGVNWYTATLLGGIFLIIAGFFDAIDGTVARVTKRTSALGSFLDSIIDKVSEIVIFIGILIGNFTNPVLVLVALSLSILVSYTRARAESMGIDLKGKGIAERAERILILSILAFIPFRDNISVALWIISILAIITILERLKIVSAVFGVSLFSMQSFSQIFRRDSMTGSTYSTSGGQNTPKFDNDKPTSSSSSTVSSKSGASASSKFSDSVREILHKPDNKKDEKINEESKPYKTEKANFLDKTDPNEMGRNTDQIIFELENEDKKMQSIKSPPPPPPPASTTSSSSASSTTDASKPENKNNETPASTTTTTTTTSTDTTSDPEDSEVNENNKESDKNAS
jgi:archaetidylinositol phosphate synthase